MITVWACVTERRVDWYCKEIPVERGLLLADQAPLVYAGALPDRDSGPAVRRSDPS